MDDWHVLAFAGGASQSSLGGVGAKETMPGVTEESKGDYANVIRSGLNCSYIFRSILYSCACDTQMNDWSQDVRTLDLI